jgi:hypothetical protein
LSGRRCWQSVISCWCSRWSGELERRIGVLIGAAATLAILSHGTGSFALIGFGAVALIARPWPLWKPAICAFVVPVAIYVPWIVYQNVLDPPGNRLLKWNLAGVAPIDQRGFVATLIDSYAALTWHDYLRGRLENVRALIGPWPGHLRDVLALVFAPDAMLAANIRVPDFFNFVASLHLFSIAVLCAAFSLPFMPAAEKKQRIIALELFFAILVICVVFAVLMFIPGSAVNHAGTYAVQVGTTVFAFTVLSLRAPPLAIVFLAAQAITVATLYAFALPHDHSLWLTQVICVAAAAGLFGYSLYPATRGLRATVKVRLAADMASSKSANS